MLETMKEGNGAGLAAIQVGEPVRLFVISAETAGTSESMVFLNPVIKPILPEAESADEGCLSFPGIFVPVRRAMRVIVEAKGLDGTLFQREATGFFARAVQHELEHLDGRLLIDHLGPVRRRMIKAKLAKAKRRQDD